MKFIRSFLRTIGPVIKPIDPFSIQFRLTVGIGLASVLGIGGIAGWTSWRMQQILLEGHKQNTVNVADRFDQDVELYLMDQMPLEEALQRVIDHRTTANLILWVKSPENRLLAQSDTLSMGSWQNQGVADQLLSLEQSDLVAIYPIQDRYLVVCANSLEIGDQVIGEVFVVEDITPDQQSFWAMNRSLTAASSLLILLIVIVIAMYVRRSLQPICRMNHLAANISADNLGEARLQLDQAPSEVKELAQTCNMMLSRLSKAWEHQRRFVSDVSHELRTPMTLVHGYLQSTLRRSDNLSDPQREGLEIAASESERIIRLLQDLLDLARADSGNLWLQKEPIMLKDLVLEVMDMAQYSGDRVMAQIDHAVEAQVDRNRLKQVLINLLDNAIKYSEPDQPITARLAREGEWAMIQVCDRGRGIPLSDQNVIFEPFYRVDEDRSRATGGTGLGLSIVKTLVEGMGGRVKVQSKLGEGSVFTVMLPVLQTTGAP
ncbi:MAG: HAMP domain-containing sensor histidine kinase [Leptolyngbyaceae cyanobacterium MO_188.B28]|nr:HAMP domain-containing sensor histidine kinase [Leptolyngbyaceae cyanobacterium MO_188.B28]